MQAHAHASCTLAKNGYLCTVTAKVLYVVVDPFESGVLIDQALIARRVLVVHVKKAENVESVLDAHVNELRFGYDYARIVYFQSRCAASETTAVYPDLY